MMGKSKNSDNVPNKHTLKPRGPMFIKSILHIQAAGKMQQTRSKMLCKMCKYVKCVTIEIFPLELLCHC